MKQRPGGYDWEKFYLAMTGLAVGVGRIQERLVYAYNALSQLGAEHMSAENRDLLRDLRNVMERLNGPDGSTVASAAAITDDEAKEFAKRICEEALRLHEMWAVDCAKQDARRR